MVSKKALVFLFTNFLSLFVILSIKAQTNNKLNWGISIGTNISKISQKATNSDRVITPSSLQAGFNANVFSEINIYKDWYFSPKIGYQNIRAQGYKYTTLFSGNTIFPLSGIISYNISNITVPLLVKYNVPNSSKIKKAGLGIFLGPQYSRYLTGKGNSSDDANSDYDLSHIIKKNQISAIGGIEYYFPVGKNQLGISSSYEYGFLNNYNKAYLEYDTDGSLHPSVISFNISYKF